MTQLESVFGNKLLVWHENIHRELPWKDTNDPYKIWLSEIILQQTRVEQGRPYYLTFIQLFPNVETLAAASEEEVLHAWQGLGYYSRARNLHQAAKTIVERFDGVFPNTYEDILSLKGVGEYTAAAIASFAFDLPYAVMDGNVKRVISRYYGVTDAIDQRQTIKDLKQRLEKVFINGKASKFNQAIMDFGAIQCKPKAPDCLSCPFMDVCQARLNELVRVIPVKSKKTKKKDRFFHYIIPIQNDKTIIRKRTSNDIWKGLFEFYYNETDSMQTPEDLLGLEISKYIEEEEIIKSIKLPKHVLSHQNIYPTLHFVKVQYVNVGIKNSYKLVEFKNLKNFAFPTVLSKNLEVIQNFGRK